MNNNSADLENKKYSELPKISIVSVNWNGAQILNNFLDNITKLNYPNKEIIIIDNGSTDASLEILKNRDDIIFYSIPKNLGFAGGNNYGIKKSSGDYILLINTDVICEEDLLLNLINKIQNSSVEKIGAVYPIIKLQNGKINTLGSFLYEDYQPYNLGFGEDLEKYSILKNTKNIIGFYNAYMLLNKKILNEIGLINKEYFLYHEETDLALRGYLNDWKYLLDEKSVVLHLHSYSSKPLSMKKIFYSERNRLFNLIKYAEPKKIFFSFYYTIKRLTLNVFKKKGLHLSEEKNVDFFCVKIIKLAIATIFGWIAVIPHIDQLIHFRLLIRQNKQRKKIITYKTI